jgi:hypothetical protein
VLRQGTQVILTMWVAIHSRPKISSDWSFYQWCHLCYDGSDVLIICDICGTATCKRCIPALGTVPDFDIYVFKCVGCTTRGTIFYVCSSPILLLRLTGGFRGCINQMDLLLLPLQMAWQSVLKTLPVQGSSALGPLPWSSLSLC